MLQQMLEMVLHKFFYISTKRFANLLPFTNYHHQGLWGINLRFRICGQKRLPHANVNAGTAAGKAEKLQALDFGDQCYFTFAILFS